jgi:hypothetical protein
MHKRVVRLLTGLVVLMLAAGGVAHAKTQEFTSSLSGTVVDVPVDFDSDSCFTASNGGTICTDTSGYSNFAGKRSAVDSSARDSAAEGDSSGGDFTAQEVIEFDFVPGTTSCNIGGTIVPGIATCTLAGTTEQGCLLKSQPFNSVYRDNSSGDLLFSAGSNNFLCDDVSKLPNYLTYSFSQQTIIGGTGRNVGATGTRTGSGHGQEFAPDTAGHGFSWFEGTVIETITTP